MKENLFWQTAVTLNKGTMFAVQVAIAHWFDGDQTREDAVQQAAEAIAKYLRQTGQSADDLMPVDIADALFARNFTGNDTPYWFEDEGEFAEEIGDAALGMLREAVVA